jgi:methylated-DNA-[protein]-cysteine S-methyltransferase
MRKNPCGPQIPCHRVIKSDGTVGNFRGGVEGAVKEKTGMLRDEGVTVLIDKISLEKYRHKFT